MTEQLVLGLRLDEEATFANFYAGQGLGWVGQLTQYLGENEAWFYLWGSEEVGRSHLLQACCHHLAAQGKPVSYIPLKQWEHLSPSLLEGLEQMALVCIDDIEQIAGQKAWEESLFHLYNRLRDSGKQLIVSANSTVTHLPLSLLDLKSRLAHCLQYQLPELAEPEKLALLQLRASERGLFLPEELGAFLLRRCSRNLNQLMAMLVTLDKASLQAKRRLTIPFAKVVLDI